MLKKALILTVGTGTRADVDIVKPLVKTINNSHPSFIGFIVSDVSLPHAEEIIRQAGFADEQFDILRLSDPDNLQTIYSEISGWIRSLMAEGYSAEEITVDYTSGTKAMTSGAVLACVASGCAGLKYITGKRKNGVVLNGTEMFVTVQPGTILAHREMMIGRRLIEEFRFDSAISVFSSINRALLSPDEDKLLDGLTNVAHGYDCWDRFQYNKVDGYLSKVPGNIRELVPFRISLDLRQRLVSIYKALDKGEITGDLLADLYNNACRRFTEGKYDDATARLYRLVEMLAQMILRKDFGIETGNVAEDKIPDTLKESIRQNRDPVDGQITVGLKKGYKLLKELGNQLGDNFLQNKKLSALLKERNDSFLAHGTKPISKEACQSLFDETRSLLLTIVPDFDALSEQLEFPWS